ncbi:AP-2 complex subunit sigma [Pyrenophora seminiperda CCB06]|uniref:AP-2 complex subunit sigma n=1 Tax=Pyrenophora seminiperda CCB06 TaxID=1302712 RepID=A0A3M7LUJ8_9PLEO|nr:AP-2 complex subunit sigma [Pyrenophora seminiperda CCB06]
MVLSFILIQNRQGKTRLAKWYAPYSPRKRVNKRPQKVHRLIAPRDQKHQSNFVEFRNMSKIVYRRYAGLFFCACVDTNDNELAYLEAIHFFVEVLDAFFGNVCELDLVFNFYKVGNVAAWAKLDGWSMGLGREEHRQRADIYRYMLSSTKCSWRAKSKRRVNRLS